MIDDIASVARVEEHRNTLPFSHGNIPYNLSVSCFQPCSLAAANDQWNQRSGLGRFSDVQNVFVTDSTFVSLAVGCINNLVMIIQIDCDTYVVNIHSAEGQTIPVLQPPNPSPFFTGRKDVLDKVGNIFFPRAAGSLIPRRSCLLWGMGGIGKTQICMKFIEEMSDK